jgi:hypothetical protein
MNYHEHLKPVKVCVDEPYLIFSDLILTLIYGSVSMAAIQLRQCEMHFI